MSQASLLWLALGCAPLLLLGGTLAGIWLGFRIVTMDAGMIAQASTKADAATVLAKLVQAEVKDLAALIEDHAERMERKRASIASTLTKLEQARDQPEAAAEPEAPAAPEDPLAGLSGRERRLAGQRLVNRGGLS